MLVRRRADLAHSSASTLALAAFGFASAELELLGMEDLVELVKLVELVVDLVELAAGFHLR